MLVILINSAKYFSIKINIMEKIINLLLVISLLALSYYVYKNSQKNNKNIDVLKRRIKIPVMKRDNDIIRDNTEALQKIGSTMCNVGRFTTNVGRNNMYHPDYPELYTYTQNLKRTDEFNAGNMPVQHYNISKNKVFSMARDVLYHLQKKTKSSYHLCDVSNTHLYKTKNQNRYVFDMILQKETPTASDSKIILNIMTLEDTDFHEDDFFKPNVRVPEGRVFGESDIAPIMVESVLIVGFINKDNPFINDIDGLTNDDAHYEFQRDYEDHNEITSPEVIRQEVINQKRMHNNEMRYVTGDNLDKDTVYYDPDYYEIPVGIYKKDGDDENFGFGTRFGTTMYEEIAHN